MQIRIRALFGVLAVVVLSFSVIGCSEESDAEPEDETTPTQVVLEGTTPLPSPPDVTTDAPPGTTASSNGMTAEMGVGTYCWTNLCVDKIGPITRDILEIESADAVLVAIPNGTPPLREVSVIALPAIEPQPLDNGETAWRPVFENSVTLPFERDGDEVRIDASLDPGTYVLTVSMFFEAGDVQYGVVLEVR